MVVCEPLRSDKLKEQSDLSLLSMWFRRLFYILYSMVHEITYLVSSGASLLKAMEVKSIQK